MILNELESLGISAGIGALNAVRRIRRIQEDKMCIPGNEPKNGVDEHQKAVVANVNAYFDQMKIETIDGRPKD